MHLWRSYILYLVLAPDANTLAPDATAEDASADDVNAKAHQPLQLPDQFGLTMRVQNLTMQIWNMQSRSTISEYCLQEFTIDNNDVKASAKQQLCG
jgi:hypothetical protein